jgi:hypothetical protein
VTGAFPPPTPDDEPARHGVEAHAGCEGCSPTQDADHSPAGGFRSGAEDLTPHIEAHGQVVDELTQLHQANRGLTPNQVAQKYGYDDAAEMRRCETAGREIDAEVDAAERAAGMGGRHHEKTTERLRELDRAEWMARLLETRVARGSSRAVDIPPDLRVALRPYLGSLIDELDAGSALMAYGFANPDDPLGLGRVPGLFVDEPVQFGEYKRAPSAPAGADELAELAQHFGYPDVGPVLAMIDEVAGGGEAVKRIAEHQPDRGVLPPGWTQKQWETAARTLFEARNPGARWDELPLVPRERWFRQVSEAFEAGRSAAAAAMVPQRLITLPPGHELEVGMSEVGAQEFAERAAGEGGAPGVPQSVVHASRELIRAGVFASDPEFAGALLAAVCGFHSYRHSGGSAESGIETLMRLLRRESLLPVTADPEEWAHPEAGPPDVDTWWQNRHDSRALSRDGGKTWWFAEGRHPGERCYSPDGGDVLGVLEECPGCGGRGVVHVPEGEPAGPPADVDELLMEAWGVIANVSEGNWGAQPPEWVAAAERWRDRWHARLHAVVREELPVDGGGDEPADSWLAGPGPQNVKLVAGAGATVDAQGQAHGVRVAEKWLAPDDTEFSGRYVCLCGQEFQRPSFEGGPEAAEAALWAHAAEVGVKA